MPLAVRFRRGQHIAATPPHDAANGSFPAPMCPQFEARSPAPVSFRHAVVASHDHRSQRLPCPCTHLAQPPAGSCPEAPPTSISCCSSLWKLCIDVAKTSPVAAKFRYGCSKNATAAATAFASESYPLSHGLSLAHSYP